MSSTIGSMFPQQLNDLTQLAVAKKEDSTGFGDKLTSAMEQLNGLQADADQQVAGVLQGNEQDVHSALIAVEKADIGFQLMMQVRNKVVNAYQEISRMQF